MYILVDVHVRQHNLSLWRIKCVFLPLPFCHRPGMPALMSCGIHAMQVGIYPTEKVFYTKVYMDQVSVSGLDPIEEAGMVDLQKQDMAIKAVPAIGAIVTYEQAWYAGFSCVPACITVHAAALPHAWTLVQAEQGSEV